MPSSFIYLFSPRSSFPSFPQSYLLYAYLRSCSPRAFIFSAYYLLGLLFSSRTFFWACLLSTCIYALPPLHDLLFSLSSSGCLAFYFVYPFLPSYQVFFLILLPLLSISFQLAFLLRCTCRKFIDAPLYDRGLSYSLCIRKCHCFLANILVKQGCFIYPRHHPKRYFLYLQSYFIL